ncbi:MAG: hypothetical protein ACI845_001666 [Gammaproteobacteria bacterium]|jgi:hypothetical protein
MNDAAATKIHWTFWLITNFYMAWNILGVLNLVNQFNSDVVASFPESHQAIIVDRPIWATLGSAIAVFAGSLSSLLLLFRKKSALQYFYTSLFGVILTMIHTVRALEASSGFSLVDTLTMLVMPLLLAAVMIWYAKTTMSKGWVV